MNWKSDRYTVKFGEGVEPFDDAWMLRTVFEGSTDSIASYKHWFVNDRKVRGIDRRISTDVRIAFTI